MNKKIAVVLFNLGGPDGQNSVRPFLFNLFFDKAIIRLPFIVRVFLAFLISCTRAKSARENYALMGGGSPLLPETMRQAEALQTKLGLCLPNAETKVFIAMRYWKPFTIDVAAKVSAWNPDELILLPLYPQYSTTTTGSSIKEWNRVYRGGGIQRTICCYSDQVDFVQAHVEKIRQAWENAGRPHNIRLLFSAHGLPQSIVDDGDPYPMQIEKTCSAVVAALGPAGLGDDWDWRLCYQSRVGHLKWLEPYTPKSIAEAAEDGRGIIIVPIAFVSEHVETLVELDQEYAELAEIAGVHPYIRVPALCASSKFIDALSAAVTGALETNGIAPAGSACVSDWRQCPRRFGAIA